MSKRSERRHALAYELQCMENRLDEVMLFEGIFSNDDDYLSGQCNSCAIVAYQQLKTLVSLLRE